MHRTWIIAVAAAFSIAGASRAEAQSTPTTRPAAATPAAVGPTRSAAALSPTLTFADAPSAAAGEEAFARRLTNGQKLMILGGAIFLTGAIIGDDAGTVIMIGGAAVGIYGLYLQLGQPGMNEKGARVGVSRAI